MSESSKISGNFGRLVIFRAAVYLLITSYFRTSPEDFLDRLGKMEKSRLSSSKSSNEREFSLPTKAKPSLVSDPTSQIREKVFTTYNIEIDPIN